MKGVIARSTTPDFLCGRERGEDVLVPMSPEGDDSGNNRRRWVGFVADITPDEVAEPSSELIADTQTIYRLTEAPYTRYQSNGTALVTFNDSGEVTWASIGGADPLVNDALSDLLSGYATLGEDGLVNASQLPAGFGLNEISVRAVIATNVDIATALNVGDSHDGVTFALDDVIALTGQTDPSENGIYQAGPAPSRHPSYDTYAEHAGLDVYVREGTAGAGSFWHFTTVDNGVLGVDALVATELSQTNALVRTNNLSDLTDVGAAQQNIQLEPGVDVQAFSENLQDIADASFADDDLVQMKSGALVGRTLAQVRTDLALYGSGLKMSANTSSTSDVDPGVGSIKWNHATQSSATVLYFDDVDAGSVDVTSRYNTWGEGTVLHIQQANDETRWQVWMVKGTIDGTGYHKLAVALLDYGGAMESGATVRIAASAMVGGYLGGLTDDITARGTPNADGSDTSITINGCAWVQTYNSNGSLATETFGGLTRTYNYSATGVFTGVSGAIVVGGAIKCTVSQGAALTTALTSAGAAAAGSRWYFSDLGSGNELIWTGDHWKPAGGEEIVLGMNTTAVVSDQNGTTTESTALRTISVPGWLNSTYSWVRGEALVNRTGTGSSTLRTKYGGTTFAFHSSITGGTNISDNTGRFMNDGALTAQIGPPLAVGLSSYGSSGSGAALFVGAVNSAIDRDLTWTLAHSTVSETATLESVTGFWGSA